MLRKIVKISRDLCNGCGQCASACAEGAIQMVDGKAALVRDSYCDGLGNCLGACPAGALVIEEREAEEFSDPRVHEQKPTPEAAHHSCPGMRVMNLQPKQAGGSPSGVAAKSALANWPVQLRLVPTSAPYLQNADILLAADCVPFAMADFHDRLLEGKVLLIACPKLDDTGPYVEKLAEIFSTNDIRSVTVAHMEVPCCFGMMRLAQMAMERAGAGIRLQEITIGLNGQVKDAI